MPASPASTIALSICCAAPLLLLQPARIGRAEPPAPSAQVVHTPLGMLVGEVTTTSAVAQVRLCGSDRMTPDGLPGAPGRVEFALYLDSDGAQRQNGGHRLQHRRSAAEAEHDYIARVRFESLKPNTRYLIRTEIVDGRGNRSKGPQARFRTLPGARHAAPVKFAVVTGMNYAKFHGSKAIDRKKHIEQNNIALPPPYRGKDKALGYPALERLRKEQIDFFVATGDNVYYDTPSRGRAKSIDAMRRKWHEQFIQPRFRQLFAEVPTYWQVDDHDYRKDDCDNTGDYDPTPQLAQRVMWEQLPYGPFSANKRVTYRTHRITRDLQIWLLEGRIHRSPNSMPDGPGKSIWGRTQRAWLRKTLLDSDATFKIIISPTPLIGPDDKRKTDNHCNIGGFRHERDSFFAWLKYEGLDKDHVYFVCGDRHWQYHSIDPRGLEEFATGALVDANARLGRRPGDPKSTDPEGTIRQPYTSPRPSGGFLIVRVEPAGRSQPARLIFEFCDEQGKRLYTHEKFG